MYATNQFGGIGDKPGGVSIFDPATWAVLDTFMPGAFPFQTVDAPSRRKSYTLMPGQIRIRTFDHTDAATLATIVQPISMVVVPDETGAWVLGTPAPEIPGRLSLLDLATDAVVQTVPLSADMFSANDLTGTVAGAPSCTYQLDTKQSSWGVAGGNAPIQLKTPCAWVATSDAPWARIAGPSGTGDATLSLTIDSNFTTTNRSATISIGGRIVTMTQASFSALPAFGFIDTPADHTTGVTGALNVSGWALDDVGVTRVRVFRDAVAGETQGAQIFIGDATFVEGARPDVQAFLPNFPNASRAGWGLQILTNVLPRQGEGTYRLIVYAEDVEGHTTLLGTRTITCTNASASLPFGSLDTPGSGETVSGTIVNFGWALTPNPKSIPIDGSTIDVVIDGVAVGHPVYGIARSDIQALFPGFANTDTGMGYFLLDTTTLADGVHTIAWVVRDSAGATQGIGSRYFTVGNSR